MFELFRFAHEDGSEPVTEWLDAMRDKTAQARVRIRLRQLQAGNFGDSRTVGEGVVELRIHVGAGHRIYCGRHGSAVVILLLGGDKKTQDGDIKRAKQYWKDWKARQT